MGKKPQIEYRPAHPADVLTTWADIAKAGRLLDWKPRVSIEEGLGRAWHGIARIAPLAFPLEMRDREI